MSSMIRKNKHNNPPTQGLVSQRFGLTRPDSNSSVSASGGRVKVTLCLDTSCSMDRVTRQSNTCLNEVIASLQQILAVARKVDLQLVAYGGSVKTIIPFTSVLGLNIPRFSAGGNTPAGEAIVRSFGGIEEHTNWLRQNETDVISDIFVLISDGEDNGCRDKHKEAKRVLRTAQNSVSVIPLLTDGGDGPALRELCGCDYLEISKTEIPTLFRRLTEVIRVVSTTSPSKITGPDFARDMMFGGE